MCPIAAEHYWIVTRFTMILAPKVAAFAAVSVQIPLVLSDDTEPEPDLLVVRLRDGQLSKDLPTPQHALLLIEVYDSTLAFDRNVKRRHYAAAGVPEVWIVNIPEETVERHAQPQAGKYASVVIHSAGAELRSTLVAEAKVRVDDLFEPPTDEVATEGPGTLQ